MNCRNIETHLCHYCGHFFPSSLGAIKYLVISTECNVCVKYEAKCFVSVARVLHLHSTVAVAIYLTSIAPQRLSPPIIYCQFKSLKYHYYRSIHISCVLSAADFIPALFIIMKMEWWIWLHRVVSIRWGEWRCFWRGWRRIILIAIFAPCNFVIRWASKLGNADGTKWK